jgi:hypothetical protein
MLYSRVISKAKQFATYVIDEEIEADENQYNSGVVYTNSHMLVHAQLLRRGPFTGTTNPKPFTVDCSFNMSFITFPTNYSLLCQVMSSEITNTSDRNIRLVPATDPDMPDFGNYGLVYPVWQRLLRDNTKLHMTSLGMTELGVSFINTLVSDSFVNVTVRKDMSINGSNTLVANVMPMCKIQGIKVRAVEGMPDIEPIEGADYLFKPVSGKPSKTCKVDKCYIVTHKGYVSCDEEYTEFLSDTEVLNLVINTLVNWRQLVFLNAQTEPSKEALQFLNLA